MNMDCKAVESLLGAWLDRELSQRDAERVRIHVEGCRLCLREKERLERLENSLRHVLEGEASGLFVERFWEELQRRIQEKRAWRSAVREWLASVFYPQRLAWAIPLAIVLLLAVFSVGQFYPGWRSAASGGNASTVDSIDGHGFNVAVFRESKTKTTVIWLFENQEGEDEAPEEPASADTSF